MATSNEMYWANRATELLEIFSGSVDTNLPKTTILEQIPCSSDQEEIIIDHVFLNKELGIAFGEMDRIKKIISKKYPAAKIIAADLNIKNMRWDVALDVLSNK